MKKLDDVLYYQEIRRKKLFSILRSEALLINLQDIMKASLFVINDSKYVQGSYRQKYIKAYTNAFILRIKDVKEHQEDNTEYLDVKEVKEAIELLLEQEKIATEGGEMDPGFFRIYKIISIYTTFVLEEPVHPVGTPFPGGLEVKYNGKNYLCPVKERQKDNSGAVCGFCIAEQDPDTI
jgi:uncharacterized protein (UPF0305 family)